MKCFYHKSDLDGICSGAIVKYFNEECEMIGIDYCDKFPFDIIEENEVVFMVDFSIQPFSEMIKLNKKCKLIWIDHHKSAIKDYENFRYRINYFENEIGGLRSVKFAACKLVFQYFNSTVVPYKIELLSLYDIWDHSNEHVLPFQYGVKFLSKDWNINNWFNILMSYNTDEIINVGNIILKYEEMNNRKLADNKVYKCKVYKCNLYEYNLLVANHGPSNSKFFDSCDKTNIDILCLWYYEPKNNKFKYSFYSVNEKVDVSKIAKNFGGGGHKGAAGFYLDNILFRDKTFYLEINNEKSK